MLAESLVTDYGMDPERALEAQLTVYPGQRRERPRRKKPPVKRKPSYVFNFKLARKTWLEHGAPEGLSKKQAAAVQCVIDSSERFMAGIAREHGYHESNLRNLLRHAFGVVYDRDHKEP